MEKPYRSYGAWIPAKILYDKALSCRQKLLYAMIHNLCNERGYCWASNQFFSKEFDVHADRITKDIKALKDAGYIITFMEITTKGTRRIIKETAGGVSENTERGVSENTDHKKIDINSNVENGISDLETLFIDNEKTLRHCPRSVLKKSVNVDEVKFVLAAAQSFNTIRAMYLGKSNQSPNNKACRQLIEMYRDGMKIENLESTLHNMFETDYHKQNNFMYITLEFLSRLDKYQIYEQAQSVR